MCGKPYCFTLHLSCSSNPLHPRRIIGYWQHPVSALGSGQPSRYLYRNIWLIAYLARCPRYAAFCSSSFYFRFPGPGLASNVIGRLPERVANSAPLAFQELYCYLFLVWSCLQFFIGNVLPLDIEAFEWQLLMKVVVVVCSVHPIWCRTK